MSLKENEMSFVEYLKNPYDAIMYREHLEGYANNPNRKYRFMFIKYESLGDNDIVSKVKKFWNLSNSHPDFVFKQRSTDWKDQPEKIKELFNNKYGKLMEWYDNLPDYFILGPGETLNV